ncbi:methionine synthase (B12-independent) [Fibrobacter sp. UWB15]|uniref:5-methyltetrahydropteroyltriglutamate-- homocysteine S-methyltransferase n=1 Tax=unclassified Fibrobacter TaxID=2634177 RepID=UPI00091EF91C|nr:MULTISPECIES: 5-methyltetrahydropteroyltriglutamate--homocysteine S-methyltransferase [unclassified Fibrobacter]PWJ63462.1 methionine synthase (B12-independent) [Fibrobacter sp. UWB6]SHG31637.1 methionine synthase (B12-independent) [Fibrobacter sp. UWB8]SMG36193.1 methionine synthase (B12-independent) [Fibrobacter sp. UWB15]
MSNKKTSVIGFPRIGKARELKFASEKFFKGEISEAELQNVAAEIRQYGWAKQKAAGIDFIPSNDFSFYDNVLDTAFLFGIVPERYKNLDLSVLEKYFAAAHGYQGEKGDVKALPMKKWFNTNYHYIVPEIDDASEFKVNDSKPVQEYNEAKAAGIQTVPTLIGSYTFLRLARYNGQKKAKDFVASAVAAYAKVAELLAAAGAEWISFAEPALVFDVTAEEKELFKSIYVELVKKVRTAGLKIALQTYFGDIRDVYQDVVALGFDAIGLDFVEGLKSLELVKSGFPKNTLLLAGIVNGKNIWRADYSQKIALLAEIVSAVGAENVVVGTSCSLLHVPYTVAAEQKLPAETLRHFAFAEEKLVELAEIASGDVNALEKNKALFAKPRVQANAKVQAELAALTAADFERKPSRLKRREVQKAEFKLPAFPTTTIGSFPQTAEVRANRAAFRKGEISKEQYVEFNKKKIAECIKLQEEIGLDVIVHGEFERNDMVEYFGSKIDGFVFTQNAWVQSYGTRCVKPPVVWGDVSRSAPITVEWSVYAQSCTKKPVKGMLTGPVTILNWSFPREDVSLKVQAQEIGFAIRDEVLDLEKNGIRIIQIDEAALREKLPLRKSDWHKEYLDWAIPAFRLVHAKVKPETQIHTHMCYSEFNDIVRDIDNMDADVITFEASRSDLKLLDALNEAKFETQVGPGVYDIHSPRVPSEQEIVDALHKIIAKVPQQNVWVNPDCGLKTRGETETTASLKNLVAAAKRLRAE